MQVNRVLTEQRYLFTYVNVEHRIIVATGFGFKGTEEKTYLERLTPSFEDSKYYLFFLRKWNP